MKKEGARGMKTPDEIKKGLECWIGVGCENYRRCSECPRRTYTPDEVYGNYPIKDALALIQQFEAENAELVRKSEQLERERDALLNIMKGYRECDFCKHGCPPEKEEHLFDLCYGCDIENCRCRNCTTKNNCWEWRGPCKENGGSDA